ncbi:MAG TPA: VOC family protein [Chthoniobacteraceae bacterium]|nr:VOC family protein [Chthoniobacteraceae bacterium]
MKVLEVAFTCYAVADMPRARAFYEGVLGLEAAMVHDSEHGSWVEYEIGPHTLSLGRADAFKPSPDGCSAALEVEDFDSAIAELKAAAVRFRIEPMPTPVCHMAMIYDPDGNSLCIHKRKPAAELAS